MKNKLKLNDSVYSRFYDPNHYTPEETVSLPIAGQAYTNSICKRFRGQFNTQSGFEEFARHYASLSIILKVGKYLAVENARDYDGNKIKLYTVFYEGKVYEIAKLHHHFTSKHKDYYSLDGLALAHVELE